MSIIKDTFFGGAQKDAAKAQVKGQQAAIDAVERAAEQAREDVKPLFEGSRDSLRQGFQGALDIFGQSIPAQTGVFQQGNVGAQQALLAGLPQFQNAILGMPVNYSQLQPQALNMPDLSFLQAQLPQAQVPQQNVTTPPATQIPSNVLGAVGGNHVGSSPFDILAQFQLR